MKHIHLTFDEKFFYKMQEHKLEKQKLFQEILTWDEYIKLLFGIKKD